MTLRVAAGAAPTLQLSGAPESIVAGTSVQLQATVTNDAPGVTWSVDGTAGGNPSRGHDQRGRALPGARAAAGRRSRDDRGTQRRRRLRRAPGANPARAGAPARAAAAGVGVSPDHHRSPTTPAGARLTELKVVRVGRGLILTAIPMRSGCGAPEGTTRAAGLPRLVLGAAHRPGGASPVACGSSAVSRRGARIGVVASLRVNDRVVAVRKLRPASLPGTHVH